MAGRGRLINRINKIDWKGWLQAGLELLKWAAIAWLLWPLANFETLHFQPIRLLAGIALFIIVSGKLLVDTLIMDFVRQKRTTIRQDAVTVMGIAAGILIIVGLVVLMTARYLSMMMEHTQQIGTG